MNWLLSPDWGKEMITTWSLTSLGKITYCYRSMLHRVISVVCPIRRVCIYLNAAMVGRGRVFLFGAGYSSPAADCACHVPRLACFGNEFSCRSWQSSKQL